jgi:hypothetical protein
MACLEKKRGVLSAEGVSGLLSRLACRAFKLPALGTDGLVWCDCVAEGLRLLLTPRGGGDAKDPVTTRAPAGQVGKDIRPATCKRHSSEENTRIVLTGLRGEDRIAEGSRLPGNGV